MNTMVIGQHVVGHHCCHPSSFSPQLLFPAGSGQASQQEGQNLLQLMRDPFQTVSKIPLQ